MTDHGFYSYAAGGLGYLALLAWALPRTHKLPFGIPFTLAVFCSLLWMGACAFVLYHPDYYLFHSLPFETLRGGGWFLVLACLLSRQHRGNNYALLVDSATAKAVIVLIALVLLLESNSDLRLLAASAIGDPTHARLLAHLLFSILGLVLVEQVYRNANSQQRWALKFLCLSLGGLFIVDFVLYSKSLLFLRLDSDFWVARGVINALVTPFLAVAMSRLQTEAAPTFFISRTVVFHTTALFGAGAYLVLMALVGFYIRDYGGTWGGVAQITFTFLALLLLALLFFSGKIRANFKFFIGKHFLQSRHDYREQWIKLSRQLALLPSLGNVPGFIVDTVMAMLECGGGGIWLDNGQGDLYLADHKNLGFAPPALVAGTEPLPLFLKKTGWVVDFVELREDPHIYEDAGLATWAEEDKKVWVILPLFFSNRLEGMVVLNRAKVMRKLNWEDRDLLKTAALQLVNALALSKVSDDLAKSRQFEAYSRISAYLVHDLKNLVAQVSLIVKNAQTHKRDPEFIDDAIDTLKNVAHKIDHILGQLKKGNLLNSPAAPVNLQEVLADVVAQQAANRPLPQLECADADTVIVGEKQKLVAIFGHLVQNAQEATPDSGSVKLEMSRNQRSAIVTVADNGCGMDQKFIAERLFKPFDTTKGNAGMGIGVHEAREYIVALGGTCKVSSQPGAGTCFTITLPLATEGLTLGKRSDGLPAKDARA